MRLERNGLRRENEQLRAEIQELKQRLEEKRNPLSPKGPRESAKDAIKKLYPDGRMPNLMREVVYDKVREQMKKDGYEGRLPGGKTIKVAFAEVKIKR
jgi:regulator of replication initiation timing